ncbi:hypothetical protein POM88_022340 [Heracleum sosnowskyi]|uniref:Uncharacterized protein n=1 Tax=Heracleum sosnowskyi TaxID=360622 RepID=A0AAD8IF32_9APIA|nr:hypothetical protein POM88_022340 [Heracleum sosnowskyi]
MDISSGDHSTKLRRSSGLQELSLQSELMVEEHESHDNGESTESDIEKTPLRSNERLVKVEEVKNVQFSSVVSYKFKGAGENQPTEKKTKWKRKTAQQEGQNEATKRRKQNLKYPTKTKKNLYTEVDDEEEIQPAKHLNRPKQHVKIKNCPRLLSEMIYCLTEKQKQWVKDTGFGQLLAFDLELLLGSFAYNVLQIFEHNSVSLRLSNREINITEEDVSDVLGLPNGGDSIMLGSVEEYK